MRVVRSVAALVAALGMGALATIAAPAPSAPPPAGALGVGTTVYVGNVSTNTITSYAVPPTTTTQNVKPTGTITGVTDPYAMAFDAHGDLWVAANSLLSEFTATQVAAGGAPTAAVKLGLPYSAAGLAFDGAGDLWASSTTPSVLFELTPTQLAAGGTPTPAVTITSNSASPKSLSAPYKMAFDAAGDLWVPNLSNTTLVEFTPSQLAQSGTPTPKVTIETTATHAGVYPFSLAFDAKGDLWVGSETNTTILEFTPSQLTANGPQIPALTLTRSESPGLAFDATGNLWVSTSAGNAIDGYEPAQLATHGAVTPHTIIHGSTTGLHNDIALVLATPPTVTAVTPSTQQVGATVTVSGTGFTSSTVVSFDGAEATTVVDVSPFTLTAKVPPGSGTVTVTASTWAGSSSTSAADHFTYAQTGYDLVGEDGGVFVFDAPGQTGGFFGSLPGIHVTPTAPIVGLVPTLSDHGYFLVGTDGGVFAFGTAPFLGSLPGEHVVPNAPITGIVAADTDHGYFLVGADGGVFAFGTVPFLGSLPQRGIAVTDIVGIASTPSGNGYWVVAATGKVYAFGTAKALGTANVTATTNPVTAIAGTPTGGGYWITTLDGTVKAFGNAKSFGTLPAIHVTPTLPIVGIVHTSGTGGYWLIGADGGIFAFGDAGFVGSLPGDGVHVTDIVGAVPN